MYHLFGHVGFEQRCSGLKAMVAAFEAQVPLMAEVDGITHSLLCKAILKVKDPLEGYTQILRNKIADAKGAVRVDRAASTALKELQESLRVLVQNAVAGEFGVRIIYAGALVRVVQDKIGALALRDLMVNEVQAVRYSSLKRLSIK